MKMRACDYIVEIMKIIGKVSSSSLEHNVNRNFEERPQLKDLRSNQIEKSSAYHIILNSIQLVTGIPGGNIQLYVVSWILSFGSFLKRWIWPLIADTTIAVVTTCLTWTYNIHISPSLLDHWILNLAKEQKLSSREGSRPCCSSGKCRGGLSEERADPRKTPSCQRIILREGNLSIPSKNYSKVLDLMNHGRSDTDGGHDTLLIPIHGGARLGSIDSDLGQRDGKCFHIYFVL